MMAATRPRTLTAGLVAALLALTVTGCKAGGSIHIINNTNKTLTIYTTSANPAVNSRVATGTAPANDTVDLNIDISEGCQPYALEALDGNTSIARHQAPTCVGDTWTIISP